MSTTKQKPEMTVEEFEEKHNRGSCFDDEFPADLRSVILGQLMDFRDCHNRTHFAVIDIDEIDEFLNENYIE